MKIIPSKRVWKCDVCGETFKYRREAEDCWKDHQDPEWPEVTSLSICGCGAEFPGHEDDACPKCKKDMETYKSIIEERHQVQEEGR